MSYFANPKKVLINKLTGKTVNTTKNLEQFQDAKTFIFDKSKTTWNISHMFDSYDVVVRVYEKSDLGFVLISPSVNVIDSNTITINIGYETEGRIDILFFGELYDVVTPVPPNPTPTPTPTPSYVPH